MGLLYKNHHPDKTVSDSGRTILPYLPLHSCLAGGLECLQWLLRFPQQLAGHSNGGLQPQSPKRKLSSWAEGGDGATLPGLCVGTQGWQSTPRYCFALLHEIKRAAEKSATHGLRLLCKNECPAPPLGPRGGSKQGGRGTGHALHRVADCPTRRAQVRLPRDLVSAARFSQKAKLLVTFSTRARIQERRRPRPASPECTPPPAAHPPHLGSMGRKRLCRRPCSLPGGVWQTGPRLPGPRATEGSQDQKVGLSRPVSLPKATHGTRTTNLSYKQTLKKGISLSTHRGPRSLSSFTSYHFHLTRFIWNITSFTPSLFRISFEENISDSRHTKQNFLLCHQPHSLQVPPLVSQS